MELTITLSEWELELLNFIKDGYNHYQEGEEATLEDVLHGVIEFFVLAKTQQELPEEIESKIPTEMLH